VGFWDLFEFIFWAEQPKTPTAPVLPQSLSAARSSHSGGIEEGAVEQGGGGSGAGSGAPPRPVALMLPRSRLQCRTSSVVVVDLEKRVEKSSLLWPD
jgi:hypothetical protein